MAIASFIIHYLGWQAKQMRDLLDAIPITQKMMIPKKHGGGEIEVTDVKGLCDRAIIAIMAYTLARVSAVAGLKHRDYRLEDAYLAAAANEEQDAPVFQSLTTTYHLTNVALTLRDILRIVKERCEAAGLPDTICNHTFRGTGITVFLQNGVALETGRKWRIIPTREQQSLMTGARIWRRCAKSKGGLRLNERGCG